MTATTPELTTLVNEIAALVEDDLNARRVRYNRVVTDRSGGGAYGTPWAVVDFTTRTVTVRIYAEDPTTHTVSVVVTTTGQATVRLATFTRMPAGVIAPVAAAFLS